MPLGLGDRLIGDVEPELPSPPPAPAEALLLLLVGRAMGAIIGRATGPGSFVRREPRLPCPGARERMEGAEGEGASEGFEAFDGGRMGAIGGMPLPPLPTPRLNCGSNGPGPPALKFLGSADGASPGC